MRDELSVITERVCNGLFTPGQWQGLAAHLELTRRQRQVACLICHSETTDGIATQLEIAPNTVRLHTKNLFAKLGVHDRVGGVVRLVLAQRSLPAEP